MKREKTLFLLINGSVDLYWTQILAQALETLGALHIAAEHDVDVFLNEHDYDLIIIDTSGVQQVPQLIEHIRAKRLGARIVVVTASPTWARAREAFLAGAIDYTRKSLEPDEIMSVLRSALNKPLAPNLSE